ncbi:hypothetical protein LCGC14_2070160 [marine sediment metagenome]|uniref:Uncharacterized protein n=1 Tax=marine sediment metagenome TaxID=412755 RepID=A0A0F9EIJ7_9ZZZZ
MLVVATLAAKAIAEHIIAPIIVGTAMIVLTVLIEKKFSTEEGTTDETN